MRHHQASVRCVDIHDYRFISVSYDHTARLWNINIGECIHTFIGNRSQIYTILFWMAHELLPVRLILIPTFGLHTD